MREKIDKVGNRILTGSSLILLLAAIFFMLFLFSMQDKWMEQLGIFAAVTSYLACQISVITVAIFGIVLAIIGYKKESNKGIRIVAIILVTGLVITIIFLIASLGMVITALGLESDVTKFLLICYLIEIIMAFLALSGSIFKAIDGKG